MTNSRMTNLGTTPSLFRALKVAAVSALSFVLCHSSFAAPAAAPITVDSIQPTRSADLVLLSSGFDAGLRQGMVCRLTRGGAAIGEVLLVELRPSCASALIVSLAPGQSIRAGDVASVKILKS